MTALDRAMMKLAHAEAVKGQGRTAPNPAVGCVVVDFSGEVVGTGYHEGAGLPHAEPLALARAGKAARGGTLYVTLEPCAHQGRTPPCADAIITSGVRRVVAAMSDPDPRVNGRGFQALRRAGISVQIGPGTAAARRLNEGYTKARLTSLPFVVLKMAMSMDGKIASASGGSKWVTGPAGRSMVQGMRDGADAVMVGIGTVLQDDPSLTVRSDELPAGWPRAGRNPVRVIVDSKLRLPSAAKVLQSPGRCIVLGTTLARSFDAERLRSEGAEVILLEDDGGRVPLRPALKRLCENAVHSVLLEGGAELAAGALDAGMVDRIIFVAAPKLLGGRASPGPIGGAGACTMSDALTTGPIRVRRIGDDVILETELGRKPPGG